MARIEKKTKRYPSDLTDEEWSAVEPFMPKAGTTALRERRKNWTRFSEAVDAFLRGPRAWPA